MTPGVGTPIEIIAMHGKGYRMLVNDPTDPTDPTKPLEARIDYLARPQ